MLRVWWGQAGHIGIRGMTLIPLVNYRDAAGRIQTIYPELADSIAVTEMRIAAAVRAAQDAGTGVTVAFVATKSGVAISRWGTE